MYACWSPCAYACMYTYIIHTYRPTYTHKHKKVPREELNNTLLNNSKLYHRPLPIPLLDQHYRSVSN